ncbi:trypsin zeta-like [Drosophila madeirensis]|uniref:trypsin n=1 Tax=Drosophila madeirensis TaxID=30013 RepID=A0AAU9G2D6_DROMD
MKPLSLLLWLALVPVAWSQARTGGEDDTSEEEEDDDDGKDTDGVASIGHLASVRMLKMDRVQFGAGHVCAGSLIRDNAVLTAAQCFVDREIGDGHFLPMSEFFVVLGTPNRFESSPNTLKFELKHRVLMQDMFDMKFHEMDVALLILNGSVPQPHPAVQPIQIADQIFGRKTECQMSGWGRDPTGYSSEAAVSVRVPFIGPRICLIKQMMQEFFVQPGMICAKHFGKVKRGYCTGDAGGSLECEGQLAGIVSWGISCDSPYHPGIYTDVLYYTQWINESLANPTQLDDYFASVVQPMISGAFGRSSLIVYHFIFILYTNQ